MLRTTTPALLAAVLLALANAAAPAAAASLVPTLKAADKAMSPNPNAERRSLYMVVSQDEWMQCGSKCQLDHSIYYGDCGALAKESSQWCSVSGKKFCCGHSESDCCEADGGAIAGIVIALIVVLAASITGCAYCGKCCCFSYRKEQQGAAVAQPGVVMVQPVASKV